MSKKKPNAGQPYQSQEYIVEIDLYLNGSYIKPGTLVKIKHDRTAWTFVTMYHNLEKDVQWVNLMSPMGYKSVRPDRIAGEFIAKRSRRKKEISD